MEKQAFYKHVQKCLEKPPVIVWGSGATIPLGLPAMGQLNEAIATNIENFDANNNNLEEELSKDKYKSNIDEISSLIWREVNEKDLKVINNIFKNDENYIIAIKKMIHWLLDAHPKVANIITTNYDRVIEHICGYYDLNYTDGFSGKNLSTFDSTHFNNENLVNIIKVHGSLSWFEVSGRNRFCNVGLQNSVPKIIIPSSDKYQQAYETPYRELIQKSDDLIRKADSFLAVGFGFNDVHLTPKIREKVQDGTPIVVIAKSITEGCLEELKNAQNALFIEEDSSNDTFSTVTIKNNGTGNVFNIEGYYWQLDKFMEIFL